MGRNFYSHAPRGARRVCDGAKVRGNAISTHTPLAGRDCLDAAAGAVPADFYSHAPRGARPEPYRQEETHG